MSIGFFDGSVAPFTGAWIEIVDMGAPADE